MTFPCLPPSALTGSWHPRGSAESASPIILLIADDSKAGCASFRGATEGAPGRARLKNRNYKLYAPGSTVWMEARELPGPLKGKPGQEAASAEIPNPAIAAGIRELKGSASRGNAWVSPDADGGYHYRLTWERCDASWAGAGPGTETAPDGPVRGLAAYNPGSLAAVRLGRSGSRHRSRYGTIGTESREYFRYPDSICESGNLNSSRFRRNFYRGIILSIQASRCGDG